MLRGHELDEAEEWSTKRETSLDQLEREFIQASRERRQQQTAREQYRGAVVEAWIDEKLDEEEVASLKDLANTRLKLSPSTAAAVEREIMGDTRKAVLKRQERLNEHYTEARRLHRAQEWQRVVDVFDEIHHLDEAYPDQQALLVSARRALELEEAVAVLYDEGQRHMAASEWSQASRCFEEILQMDSSYRDAEKLLMRARDELAKPSTVNVPDLTGQKASQPSSALDTSGLKLGTQNEVLNSGVTEGEIVGQSPEAETEVEVGSSVSVTVSKGPALSKSASLVHVRTVIGLTPGQAPDELAQANLRLTMTGVQPSDNVPEGKILSRRPAAAAGTV